jgi:hypothetical protein
MADRIAIRKLRRHLEWDTSHAEEYLTLCAQNRREQDVLRAQLIAAGKNPNPPPE